MTANAAELIDDMKLPPRLAKAVDSHEAAVKASEREAARLQAMRAKAAKALVEAGLSVRDASELLGVSHQRVHQLVS